MMQSGVFLAMLAINLGRPKIALEVLEPYKNLHFTPVFLLLIALTDCGRFEEAAQLVEQRKTKFPKTGIYASVVSIFFRFHSIHLLINLKYLSMCL